jgi:tetratricopeptide (TPR) repeat protein
MSTPSLSSTLWPSSLLALGRTSDALLAYDELVERCGQETAVVARQAGAGALAYKGSLLEELDQRERAIASFDELLARFGHALEPDIRKQVALALCHKGRSLEVLGRREDAAASYGSAIAHFPDRETPEIDEAIGFARARYDVLSAADPPADTSW